MNIAVFQTKSGSHFFLDYRGRWRPIADLKKCEPKIFVGGIPNRYRPPEPALLWAEPFPEYPNLRQQGALTD
ncbi:MAG: hypothetical protein ABSF26_21445 [Thermoguttaceae bacterium]|jgi:hypothetical protein